MYAIRSYYVFSVIHSDEIAKRAKTLVEEIVGSLDNPGTGIMFTVPVDWAVGLIHEEEEV